MKHIKHINEVRDVMFDPAELTNFWHTPKSKKELEEEYVKKIGKNGQLYKYLQKEKLTFGMLDALWEDAIKYKKKREYIKGTYKFIHRALPMALGPFLFPIWIINMVLGSSRALNKILVSALKVNTYHNFLTDFVEKTMAIMEGDIRLVMEKDWFYNIFAVDPGLIKMVRQEHIIEFAKYMAYKMKEEDEDKIVPENYLENEFRTFLNNKFKFKRPLGMI